MAEDIYTAIIKNTLGVIQQNNPHITSIHLGNVQFYNGTEKVDIWLVLILMTTAASSGHVLLPCMNCIFFNSSYLPISPPPPGPLLFWHGWYEFCCHHPSWPLLSSLPPLLPSFPPCLPPTPATPVLAQSGRCSLFYDQNHAKLLLRSPGQLSWTPPWGRWTVVVVPSLGQTWTHRPFTDKGRRFRWEKLCIAFLAHMKVHVLLDWSGVELSGEKWRDEGKRGEDEEEERWREVKKRSAGDGNSRSGSGIHQPLHLGHDDHMVLA